MEPRATVDIDLVVDARKLKSILQALGAEFGGIETTDVGAAVRVTSRGREGTGVAVLVGRSSRPAGVSRPVTRIDSATLARPAQRPAYSVLSNLLFEHVSGHRMTHWQDAVDRYLRDAAERAATEERR